MLFYYVIFTYMARYVLEPSGASSKLRKSLRSDPAQVVPATAHIPEASFSPSRKMTGGCFSPSPKSTVTEPLERDDRIFQERKTVRGGRIWLARGTSGRRAAPRSRRTKTPPRLPRSLLSNRPPRASPPLPRDRAIIDARGA